MTKGCLFGQPFSVASNYFFLLIFALSEFQQLGIRNQNAPSDALNRQLLFRNERVQHSLANSDEPSSIRFAVEQDVLVHIETSGFSLI